jgi:predicted MPP superfamily phosphohydrolase
MKNKSYKIVMLFFIGAGLFSTIILVNGFKRFANPEFFELSLDINKEDNGYKRLICVAVSDIHLGNVVTNERLSDWIKLINNLNPDIILLVGDIFDRNFDQKRAQEAIETLSQLSSRFGTYAVLGNHEYYLDIEKISDYMDASGIVLLRDQALVVDDKIIIAGRDDVTNLNRKSIDSIIAGFNTNLPVILLNHQPSDLHGSVRYKVDLHLSGHLHDGQIFPYNIILSKLWDLSYGYRKTGNTNFYVSSGLGLRILPLRIGTHSEIVRIQFK